MSAADNGGPAFPVPGLQHDAEFNGMTLRDYFAARAMQSLLQSLLQLELYPKQIGSVELVRSAWELADLMLKERAK